MPETDMTIFENKHRVNLPDAYKEISDFNVTVQLAGDTWDIIKPDDLEFYLSEASETSGFPTNGLPLAQNQCGNYIFVFPIYESNYFSLNLFLFDHETEEVYVLKETVECFREIQRNA